MRLLPHPFTGADREAGYRCDISILQAEFSTTQVLDRPVHGRVFFEQVIRENLDLGRPEEIQLIFNRRIPRQRCTTDSLSRFGVHGNRVAGAMARLCLCLLWADAANFCGAASRRLSGVHRSCRERHRKGSPCSVRRTGEEDGHVI